MLYDGQWYHNVQMQYDEISDVVVMYDQSRQVQLLSPKLAAFKLYNATFVRMEKDSATAALVSTGFYNILYKGNTSLLMKEVKTLRDIISPNMVVEYFAVTNQYYYLEKDGKIFSVKNKKDLFKIWGNRKKEVQQFVKANKLSFRKDRQNMLTKSTAYYDSLK